MLNFFLTKKQKAAAFAVPQLVITDRGIISIDKLKKGNKIIGAGDKVNTVEKIERTVKENEWFYLINKTLMVYKDQTIMIDGNGMHAFEVKKGDFLTRKDGTRERVTSIKKIKGNYYFHRLTVSGDHSYYINEVLVHNASRYWVRVAGGTWDNTSTGDWSTTSGGGAGSANPTTSDDVFFDGNSGSGTVVVGTTGNRDCLSISFAGFTGTISMTSAVINVYGSITLGSGMTFTATGSYFLCFNTGARNITSNGKTLPVLLSMNGVGGSYTLQDNFNTSEYLDVTNGTFDANNFNVTCKGLSTSSGTTITLGSGTWTVTGVDSSGGGEVWDMDATTLTANTATIKFTDTSNTAIIFKGGSKTYGGTVWFSRGASTGGITIQGTNTFAVLKDDGTGTHTITMPNVTTTISSAAGWQINGTSGHLITLQRTGASGAWTVSIASGTVSADYLSISRSTASGGATFYAGANSTDGGNNSGWIFTAPPPPTNIKTYNTNAYANIKTIDTNPIANVKTLNTNTNT